MIVDVSALVDQFDGELPPQRGRFLVGGFQSYEDREEVVSLPLRRWFVEHVGGSDFVGGLERRAREPNVLDL